MRTNISITALCVMLLVACTTTGDPNEGGLIGWSEKKAMQRAENLRQDALQAQRRKEELEMQRRELRSREYDLSEDVANQEAILRELVSEADALRTRLEVLLREHRGSKEDLARAKKEFDNPIPQIQFNSSCDARKRLARDIEEHNERLTLAINLLLRQR